MNMKLSHPFTELEEEEDEQITVIHYTPSVRTEPRLVRSLRPVVQWFGVVTTVLWGVAALTPDTFKVPVQLQGWVFLTCIVWFFAFCTGVFNL